MWEYVKLPIIVGIISLVIIFTIIYFWCRRHSKFINNAKSITRGMELNKVLNIMGQPTSKENDGNKLILIWEKNQWKGVFRGGTLTRAVKIVFIDNKVVSVSEKNLNESAFW